MARQTTPQDILAAARKRNEDRLGAIERIVGEHGTRARIKQAEEAMAAAIAEHQRTVDATKAEDAAAYADALKVWTVAELRGVGIRPVEGKQPRPALAQAATRSRSRRAARVPSPEDVERAGAQGLMAAQLQREAEASVALDRDETHVVGEPVGADA